MLWLKYQLSHNRLFIRGERSVIVPTTYKDTVRLKKTKQKLKQNTDDKLDLH